MQQGEIEAAAVIRSVWHEIVGSHGAYPVDPIQIATNLGIDVFPAPLDAQVSGALVKSPGQDPRIFLNRDDSKVRQRFTAAHELGHYVLRARSEGEHYEFVDLRDTIASNGTDREERFANAFAAALLMPEAEVRAQRNSGRQLVELAHFFGVSQEAMSYRLRNLGISIGSI